MSDVITAVKGQAVNFTNDEEITFTISELLKRVDILMKHELKNAIIYLNVAVKTDENTVIKGDVNSLVQIINNMLSNAIQAYNGKPEQTIELIVTKDNSNCIISIQDVS
jgi:C4-dicarboxylate-specific signal transduction histidine kinase